MAEIDSTEILNLNPSQDLFNRGFDNGVLYTLYNFINHELDSTPDSTYYISEISSNRTEIRLKSNFIDNDRLEEIYKEFKEKLDSSEFFDEFYVAFEGNNYNIGINCFLDTSKEQYSLLVKLYDALPSQFKEKDEVYIVTKTAETKLYKVSQEIANPSTDPIEPTILFEEGFELENQSIIPNENLVSTFTPDLNTIELYIYDVNLNLVGSELNFSDYTITAGDGTGGAGTTGTLSGTGGTGTGGTGTGGTGTEGAGGTGTRCTQP